MIGIGGILLFRSPACTAYRQLTDGQYRSAERIYENAIQNTLVNERYFDLLSDVYLNRVEQAEKNGEISETEAMEAYEVVSGMTGEE